MKNKYEIRGDETAIFIKRKGKVIETLIDTEDLPIAQSYFNTWCADYYGYIYSSDKKLKLHRCIMNAPKGKVIDHINHNPLDNRKCNLRIVTHGENMQNIKGAHKRNKSSKIRNVTWHKGMKKWWVRVSVNRKAIDFGYFDDLKEAMKVAEMARSKYVKYSNEAHSSIPNDDLQVYKSHKSNIQSGIRGIHWDKTTRSWRVVYKGSRLSNRFKELDSAIAALADLKARLGITE